MLTPNATPLHRRYDSVTGDLQRLTPWTVLYADHFMLASKDKDNLKRQTQEWSDRLARFGIRLYVKN